MGLACSGLHRYRGWSAPHCSEVFVGSNTLVHAYPRSGQDPFPPDVGRKPGFSVFVCLVAQTPTHVDPTHGLLVDPFTQLCHGHQASKVGLLMSLFIEQFWMATPT